MYELNDDQNRILNVLKNPSHYVINSEENGIKGNPDYAICKTKRDIEFFLTRHQDVAVKPDVLTGGKGVKITGEHLFGAQDVIEYALDRINSDGLVVIDEKLEGREFTLQAFSDGKNIEIMPLVPSSNNTSMR